MSLDNIPGRPGTGAVASQATVIEQTRAAAEVAAAVMAARQVPRDEQRCYERMRTACANFSLAERAFYSYPATGEQRREGEGDTIDGPTVALARELAAIWGNCEVGTQELSRDDAAHRSEVRAFARDWESNAYFSRTMIVPHIRYTARDPNRAGISKMRDIDQNNNSVAGRAEREVVFKMLPAAMLAEAKAICHQTLERGSGDPIEVRRAAIVGDFGRARPPVLPETLERKVGRKVDEWTGGDVARLGVLFRSIRDGELSRVEAFPFENTRAVTAADLPSVPVAKPDTGLSEEDLAAAAELDAARYGAPS